MEIFSALLAICAENSPLPGEYPAQRPVTRNFDIFFEWQPTSFKTIYIVNQKLTPIRT